MAFILGTDAVSILRRVRCYHAAISFSFYRGREGGARWRDRFTNLSYDEKRKRRIPASAISSFIAPITGTYEMLYRGHIRRNKKVNGRLVFAFRQKNNVISSRRKSLQCYNNILYNLNLCTASFLCNYENWQNTYVTFYRLTRLFARSISSIFRFDSKTLLSCHWQKLRRMWT